MEVKTLEKLLCELKQEAEMREKTGEASEKYEALGMKRVISRVERNIIIKEMQKAKTICNLIFMFIIVCFASLLIYLIA